jgi:cell division protein FtsQ
MRQLISKFPGKAAAPKPGAARKVPKATRRPAPPRWRRPILCGIAAIAILGILFGGPLWLWRSGTAERGLASAWDFIIVASARAELTIDDVFLEGRHFSDRTAVAKAVDLRRGTAILGFSLNAMRERLIAIPWITDAHIERRLPNVVHIRLTERQPIALWQRKGRLALVDSDGKIIKGADLRKFRELVILVGKGAPKEAPTLFAMLSAEPALSRLVTAATRIGGRRWTLSFAGGVRLHLPEIDPHLAWTRLAGINRQKKLLARDIKLIDMRLPDRMIVKPGALGAQMLLRKGKNT